MVKVVLSKIYASSRMSRHQNTDKQGSADNQAKEYQAIVNQENKIETTVDKLKK
jgi:hypothetical protein